jgi:hypothetical protein
MNTYKKLQIISPLLLISSLFSVTPAFAAAPDGLGPWADSVFSFHQGLQKDGLPVAAARSNPAAALGVAENTPSIDSTFVSLGFGGNIVLGFDNGISAGAMVVEATKEPGYPIETAKIEMSQDAVKWVTAGNLSQGGTVNKPKGIICAKYVRITDTSNPNNFSDAIADGYDVDGVKATGNPCTPISNNGGGSCTSIIKQSNNSTIINGTTVVQNTGNNTANKNTGGSTSIITGNTTGNVTVTTTGSSNTVNGGTCSGGNTTINILNNGAGSTNNVNIH